MNSFFNILRTMTLVIMVISCNPIISAEIINDESEFIVTLLKPNDEIRRYTMKAKPGEISILINAAKAAAYSLDVSSDEKIEKYEESMPFIRIEDENGQVLYESPLYKGYKIIETLIQALIKEHARYLKAKKLNIGHKRKI